MNTIKKKLLSVLSAVAMMALVAYASQANNDETMLSDMALENVEALAGDINPECKNGCLTEPGSCKCNGHHPYLEATWPDTDDSAPED